MSRVKLQIPPKLIPVFLGQARYRGAYGGRGSAKTRTFAKMTAVRGLQWSQAGEEGVIVCGREFMNSLADSSMSEVKAAIRSEPWLMAHYEIGETYIRTKDKRIEYVFTGLRHNLDSIKSKARIKLLWADEAEAITETAWQKTVPSVREHDSEVWVTWNPERKNSATHKRFREDPPEGAKIIEMNHTDNPWFPDVLEQERLEDLEKRAESYDHVWGGGFKTVTEGAYFATHLTKAKEQGRIGNVAADPLMTIRLVADIGGTGARADSFVFWAMQFIGREIRVLDHYEVVGQDLAAHLAWLRERGYTPDRAQIWLPHDGATQDKVYNVSYESAFRDAGYKVTVVPNQGKGAAGFRIEAARRLFPSIWFNAETTVDGREALGAYHEHKDEKSGIGLGPKHDWASHSADAFGLGCVIYEEPRVKREEDRPRRRVSSANGWMGA
jgi:phage terminase large subunit